MNGMVFVMNGKENRIICILRIFKLNLIWKILYLKAPENGKNSSSKENSDCFWSYPWSILKFVVHCKDGPSDSTKKVILNESTVGAQGG